MKVESVKPNAEKNLAEVRWQDGHTGRFHAIWMRCNCRCDTCKRTIVGQENVDRTKLPDVIHITDVKTEDEGTKILFTLDCESDHTTVMDSDWMRNACYCDDCINNMICERDMKFHPPSNSEIPYLENESLDKDEGMFKFIGTVLDRGFAVVKNVPQENGAVLKAGEKMASIIETIYGRMFDVFDNNSTENVASTNIGLPFHNDQCSYESAPGIQLLHAIEFDEQVEGGNSLLVDMFHLIDILRRESPEDFKVLSRVPVAFGTIDYDRRSPAHMINRKPIITLDYDDQVVGWSWNPGIEQTLRVHEEDVEKFYKAYKHLLKLINDPNNWFKFRLKSGEMLVLHNRRMAHARDEYKTNGGRRRLQGTYVDIEELRSKYVVLGQKLGNPVVAPKIGTSSCI